MGSWITLSMTLLTLNAFCLLVVCNLFTTLICFTPTWIRTVQLSQICIMSCTIATEYFHWYFISAVGRLLNVSSRRSQALLMYVRLLLVSGELLLAVVIGSVAFDVSRYCPTSSTQPYFSYLHSVAILALFSMIVLSGIRILQHICNYDCTGGLDSGGIRRQAHTVHR